jgi:hypothetical protein
MEIQYKDIVIFIMNDEDGDIIYNGNEITP